MRLLTRRADFLVACLDLPAAAEVEDARWEPFQLAHLNDDSILRIEDKARQIAWSFTVAAEAVANAVLCAESTIFVSINQDEAKEKVRYSKRVLENLTIPPGFHLSALTSDSVMRLEFDNGARILSLPSRPPRGKAKMHIVLDEFAHVMHDDAIYVAAMPVIAKGGRLRIGSSPMGAGGKHWEISQEELQPYPGFTRARTPWWKVQAFCKDGILPPDTVRDCPVPCAGGMTTEERVERYGNDRIQLLYDAATLDDFQQEHECRVVDETISYFTWDLIRSCQNENLLHWHVKSPNDVAPVAVEIKRAISRGEVEDVLVGGVDVGRKKHLTEIILLGTPATALPIRLMVSLDRIKFDVQEKCLRHLMQVLPVSALLIDQNGLGMQLAENLEMDTPAQGITFSNASKALWATELKIQMERANVILPVNKALAYQIHSIKQKITAAKNVVYDTEVNERHHADKLWALALAVWAARENANVPYYGPALQWQRD